MRKHGKRLAKPSSSVFLFRRNAESNWKREKRIGFWCWNGAFLVLSALGVGLLSLLLAVGPYPLYFIKSYVRAPVLLPLNLLPVLALGLLFYGLAGRAWLSFLLTAAITLGFSVANYFKLTFRDDPLLFGDLLLLKEAGNMVGNYALTLTPVLVLCLVCVAAGALFLFFCVRGKAPVRARISLCVWVLLCSCGFASTYLDEGLYNGKAAYYGLLDSQWSSTQQYLAHGFVYPFLHSISDAVETPPEGYSAKEAEQLLAQYESADIPADKKVNVVAIMLEAYNDFTKFGVPELATDVYETWHQLEAEGYSGNLLTNIFAGGTVDTERCFLTGYSTLRNFRGNTNAYPWYFRSQGYKVEGMHPCFEWFYNRKNVNAYLGFENYAFVENYFGELTNDQVAMDDIFFPELLKAYQAGTAGDQPYFSFSVTYQGHGPYDSDRCWWGEKGQFVVDDGTYTEEQQYILDNYFGSLANTNQHLKELTDYFRQDDEPVVLVLFGDHNPWMGDGNSVYQAMGIDFDLGTIDGFYNYYATRYLIWANDAAKEALGTDIQGQGPDLGPSFLMQELFRLCGWEGPDYLQATAQTAETLQLVHTYGRYLEDHVLTTGLSPAGEDALHQYRLVEYYYRNHFSYNDRF